jgi:hypothetical protein
MDTAEVRRRLRAAIVNARAAAQARRERTDAATRAYQSFLSDRAVPLFHTFANALVAEGLRFKVFTPAESVRLASESGADNYIELVLDTAGDVPQVIGRTNHGRGRHLLTSEKPLKDGADVASLTEDDVLEFLLAEIQPFVAR